MCATQAPCLYMAVNGAMLQCAIVVYTITYKPLLISFTVYKNSYKF